MKKYYLLLALWTFSLGISTAPEECERLADGACEVWCGDRIKQ